MAVEEASSSEKKKLAHIVTRELREAEEGLSIDQLTKRLASRREEEIRDAVWYLIDGGEVRVTDEYAFELRREER